MDPWMQDEVDRLVALHGTVPPPWVVYHEHPYSLFWRMGGGESHLMVWSAWWSREALTEEQRVLYFRHWPPPHCWLEFLIGALWNIDTFDEQEDLAPYFERTANLGFGTQKDYERDLDDPKWLEGPSA